MKKFTIVFLLFGGFFFNCLLKNSLKAQTATATITYGGFQACGGCTVCGADYWCFNTVSSYCGNTAACGTNTFMDPVPPGNIVTNIAISYFSGECAGGSLTATINGNAFPTVNEGNTGCLCSNSPCAVSATTGATFPCGVPAYNYGASNSLQMCTGNSVCINRIVLTMTYAPANQATPATQPGGISGPAFVCAGAAQTYSIPAVANASSYTWTVPAGWTINSGQGSTSITATPGGAGNICVTASNLCGTSAPTCFAVNLNTPSSAPSSASASPNPICQGSATTLSVSGGSLGVGANWNWYTGSCGGPLVGTGSSISVSPGSSTTYFVAAVGTCNTTACASTSVTVNPPTPVTPSASGTASLCAGSTQTYSTPAVSGATNYTWTVPAGAVINSGQGTTSVSVTFGSSSGNVCVTASNSCGTSSQSCVAVTVNPIPVTSVNSPSICPGETATLTAGGASSYTWSAGATSTGVNTANASPGSTSSYTVTGTSSGCSSTAVATVTVASALAVTVNSPTICSGQTASLTAGGASSYTWSAGASATGVNTADATPSVTTSYTVTGTTGGCSGTAVSTVTVNSVPVTTVDSPTICEGGTAGITASGATSYTWSAGATSSGVNTANATPAVGSTTYTVTGTSSGCSSTAVSTVTVNPLPVTTVDSPDICPGETATITAAGATSYTWSAGAVSSGTNTATASPAVTTTYTVTGSSLGCTSTAVSTVTVAPDLIITVNSPSICEGSTANLTANGASAYTWSAGTTVTGTNTADAAPSVTTTYTVTGTAGTCSGSAVSTVTVDPLPVTTVNSVTICEGDTANLSAGGASTYTWSAGATPTGTNTADAIPTTTSTYTVTGSTLGCSSTAIATVTVNMNPVAVATPSTQTFCDGGTTGITISSSDPGATFAWTVSQTGTTGASSGSGITISESLNVTGTSAGTAVYTITPTSAGCFGADITVTINVNPIDDASFSYASSTYCQTGTNPSPVITGLAGGTFSSSSTGVVFVSSTSGEISLPASTAGSYDIYYTTNGACPDTDTVSIIITSPPDASFSFSSGVTAFCKSDANPTPVTLVGTLGTYTSTPAGLVFVNTSSGEIDLAASATGTYELTNTIAPIGGCASSVDSLTITINEPAIVEAGPNAMICSGSSYTITGDSIGGSTSSLVWATTGTGTFSDPTSLTTIYHPSAADAAASTVTLYVTSDDPVGPCAAVTDSLVLTISGSDVSFTLNPTTGETPLTVSFTNSTIGASSYLWDFGTGDTSNLINPDYIYTDAGIYSACLIAYNNAGCTDTSCFSIDVYLNSVFIIPNVFTPNDDNVNDIFAVQAIGLKTMDAEIFNRWGQKVYEWHTTNGGWDGRTASGVLSESGTYYFMIKATGNDQKEYFEKGSFTLLR